MQDFTYMEYMLQDLKSKSTFLSHVYAHMQKKQQPCLGFPTQFCLLTSQFVWFFSTFAQ